MTNEEFAEHVNKHAKYDMDLGYVVVALNEEAGEIAGWYKKAVLRGNKKYTDLMLKQEVGDLMYYVQRLCYLRGWTLEQVMDENKVKLDERRGWAMRDEPVGKDC